MNLIQHGQKLNWIEYNKVLGLTESNKTPSKDLINRIQHSQNINLIQYNTVKIITESNIIQSEY